MISSSSSSSSSGGGGGASGSDINIVLVVNSIIISCGSSKILTWIGKYKSGAIAGARFGKCNLGTRTGK